MWVKNIGIDLRDLRKVGKVQIELSDCLSRAAFKYSQLDRENEIAGDWRVQQTLTMKLFDLSRYTVLTMYIDSSNSAVLFATTALFGIKPENEVQLKSNTSFVVTVLDPRGQEIATNWAIFGSRET